MAGTIRRRLLLHVAVRVAAATVLLGAAFGVQLRTPGEFGVNPFFMLIALVYAVSLGFIASLRFVDRFPWLIDVHFVIDTVLVSVGVVLTSCIYRLFTMINIQQLMTERML